MSVQPTVNVPWWLIALGYMILAGLIGTVIYYSIWLIIGAAIVFIIIVFVATAHDYYRLWKDR